MHLFFVDGEVVETAQVDISERPDSNMSEVSRASSS